MHQNENDVYRELTFIPTGFAVAGECKDGGLWTNGTILYYGVPKCYGHSY